MPTPRPARPALTHRRRDIVDGIGLIAYENLDARFGDGRQNAGVRLPGVTVARQHRHTSAARFGNRRTDEKRGAHQQTILARNSGDRDTGARQDREQRGRAPGHFVGGDVRAANIAEILQNVVIRCRARRLSNTSLCESGLDVPDACTPLTAETLGEVH